MYEARKKKKNLTDQAKSNEDLPSKVELVSFTWMNAVSAKQSLPSLYRPDIDMFCNLNVDRVTCLDVNKLAETISQVFMFAQNSRLTK